MIPCELESLKRKLFAVEVKSETVEAKRLLSARSWSSSEASVATNDQEAVRTARATFRSDCNSLTGGRRIVLPTVDYAEDDFSSKARSSRARKASSRFVDSASQRARRSRNRPMTWARGGVLEAAGSGAIGGETDNEASVREGG